VTRAKLRAPSANAGSRECTYVSIVKADDAWPSYAAVIEIGTPAICIKVPRVPNAAFRTARVRGIDARGITPNSFRSFCGCCF
jgi:hypothetical protein